MIFCSTAQKRGVAQLLAEKQEYANHDCHSGGLCPNQPKVVPQGHKSACSQEGSLHIYTRRTMVQPAGQYAQDTRLNTHIIQSVLHQWVKGYESLCQNSMHEYLRFWL